LHLAAARSFELTGVVFSGSLDMTMVAAP
jgi:hypothetical protein